MTSIWSENSLDNSTCGIGTHSTDMVSEDNWQWSAPWLLGIEWLVGKPYIWCQEKTQTHPPMWFEGPCEAWGEVSRESETQDLDTVTSFLYIFEFLANQSCIRWVVAWQYLVLTRPHTCLCPGESHLPFPHLKRETCYMSSSNRGRVMNRKTCHDQICVTLKEVLCLIALAQ